MKFFGVFGYLFAVLVAVAITHSQATPRVNQQRRKPDMNGISQLMVRGDFIRRVASNGISLYELMKDLADVIEHPEVPKLVTHAQKIKFAFDKMLYTYKDGMTRVEFAKFEEQFRKTEMKTEMYIKACKKLVGAFRAQPGQTSPMQPEKPASVDTPLEEKVFDTMNGISAQLNQQTQSDLPPRRHFGQGPVDTDQVEPKIDSQIEHDVYETMNGISQQVQDRIHSSAQHPNDLPPRHQFGTRPDDPEIVPQNKMYDQEPQADWGSPVHQQPFPQQGQYYPGYHVPQQPHYPAQGYPQYGSANQVAPQYPPVQIQQPYPQHVPQYGPAGQPKPDDSAAKKFFRGSFGPRFMGMNMEKLYEKL